jgi:hypothetical protein
VHIDGSCHCGAITYEAEIDPEQVFACHCTDCQIMSAAPFRVIARVPAADFKLSGEPTIYVKVGSSGARRAQAFCGTCGTPIYAAAADTDSPAVYGLRLGSARQRDQLEPGVHYWYRSAQPWLDAMSSKETVETVPEAD